VADQEDEDDVVFLGGLRQRRDRALYLLLRRLPGRSFRILFGLLGQVDHVISRNAKPIGGPVYQRRRPTLKQFRVLRIAGETNDHREMNGLRGSRRGKSQQQ